MNEKNNSLGNEIFIEFTQSGNQMRIAAIDAKTGVEVIAIAPTSATQLQMQQLAINKLRRRLEQLNKS